MQNPGEENNALASRQSAALKALADWSKWLIAVETSVLAGLFITRGFDPPPDLPSEAIYSFSASIIFATMLMGAIPDAIQKLPINNRYIFDTNSIYGYRQFYIFPIGIWAFLQHLFALVGLGFMLAWWLELHS